PPAREREHPGAASRLRRRQRALVIAMPIIAMQDEAGSSHADRDRRLDGAHVDPIPQLAPASDRFRGSRRSRPPGGLRAYLDMRRLDLLPGNRNRQARLGAPGHVLDAIRRGYRRARRDDRHPR
ncbi:MAG TPA: hypothetical protein VFD36_25325, partial [Kofleriaceae bacterium]|nr:hypothetical protein [Kofleriaceae bacterium]